MVDALEEYIEHRLAEIALIQEGIEQLDAGQGIAHHDVVAQLVDRHILSAEHLERDRAQPTQRQDGNRSQSTRT